MRQVVMAGKAVVALTASVVMAAMEVVARKIGNPNLRLRPISIP
jgi:hypothetical protein